jgi:signal transduction histidine kinase
VSSEQTLHTHFVLTSPARERSSVLAEEKSQQLEIVAGHLTVRADCELLRLALLNLVHNAFRYRAEGLNISLRVRRRDANAVVEVVDQGPGIAPQHQQKVFERFYRIDQARSRASGGAGLGLAIARWAIERQGGPVELESELGRGSLFRIVL